MTAKNGTFQSSVQVTSATGEAMPSRRTDDGRRIVFFDIDNCLYSKDCGIAELMKDRIQAYFLRLGLPLEEAKKLHHHYYTEYGLAVRGLVRHHQVDALDYDKHCDAALPLEDVLAPNPDLQQMLARIDTSKYAIWALTNAYVNHAVRVLRLVGLTQFFDGVISCDYAAGEFSCKPEARMLSGSSIQRAKLIEDDLLAYFQQAIEAVGNVDAERLYFVDDSALNIKGAHALGWGHCVLFDEHGNEAAKLNGLDQKNDSIPRVSVVRSMLELQTVWKEIFR